MEDALLEIMADFEEIVHFDDGSGMIYVLKGMMTDDSDNFKPPFAAAMTAAIKTSGILEAFGKKDLTAQLAKQTP